MSGGVDSSAAALILKEQGYDVTGATMLLSGNENDARDSADVCRVIGIPHVVLDMRERFVDEVERPFCDSYIAGETPNPCIICNKRIKFGAFLDYATENGFDLIATGHYVKKDILDGVPVIRCASDKRKDQSYMLWQLSSQQIERSVFPLAELTKDEIRAICSDAGLSVASRKDSQDICFVPDGDYASFITKLTNYTSVEGNYIDENGKVLGKHKGNIHYTVGQRKGLGIALGEPAYVLAKNVADNTVTLGKNESLFKKILTAHSANITANTHLPGRFDVKIRYAHTASSATVRDLGNGRLEIEFDEPQRAPACGQAAVIYLGDGLVGGAFIE